MMNPVWLLMFGISIVGSNSLVLSPIASDVATSLPGSSATDVMFASAIYGAATAASALTLAPKADQIGLRRALLIALLGLCFAMAICASAPALWVLIVGQALAGSAAGLALPAIYGLSAEIAPKGRESETLGKVLTGWTLSLVAGVSLSAILTDFLHWRVVFSFLGAASLFLLIALKRNEIPETRPSGKTISPLKALRFKGLPPILFAVACYMAAFYGLYAYIGTHLTQNLGVATGIAGLAALSYGVGFGVVAPLDRLIDRHGATNSAPIVFAALLCAYVGLSALSPFAVALIAFCFVWGAANHLGLNILVGQLTALSPKQRATILGLYSAVTYAAMFVGTTAFKVVFESFGFSVIALLSAACIAPAMIGAVRRQYGEPKAGDRRNAENG
ncbi:MAG: MFS transporter [Pseudomonadota bacterium]